MFADNIIMLFGNLEGDGWLAVSGVLFVLLKFCLNINRLKQCVQVQISSDNDYTNSKRKK